ATEPSKRAIKARARAAGKPSFSPAGPSRPSRADRLPLPDAFPGKIDSSGSPSPADSKDVRMSRHADRVRATCLTPRVRLWYLTRREQGLGPTPRVPNGPKRWSNADRTLARRRCPAGHSGKRLPVDEQH